MINIAATHGAVASESGRYYRIENGAAIPTYVVPTYAYVTFTSAGLTMTERVEFELRADRPHDDMLRMLDELHRLTGVAPHEMTIALPIAAIALIRTDRRYLNRFDPWGYDTLGVKAANIADYFNPAPSGITTDPKTCAAVGTPPALRHPNEIERLGDRLQCTCGHQLEEHALGRDSDGGRGLLVCNACACDLFESIATGAA